MQHILVTGAGGGIGSTIVKTITVNGDTVVGLDRADVDLSSYPEIETYEKKTAGEGTSFDWIIFSHGFIDTEGDIEKQAPEDIAATYALNTLSIAYLAKLFIKHVRPGGGMIAISSMAGLTANGRHAVYSSSKGGTNVLMQALARSRPELNFISVCPGPTNTSMREKFAHDAKSSQSPEVVAQLVADIVQKKQDYRSGDIIGIKNGEISIASRL